MPSEARQRSATSGAPQRSRFAEDHLAAVAAIAHDLRTPLARIRFRMERDPEGARATVLADVTQMERMIDALLDFARDGAASGPQQLIELRSLLECVADAAAIRGEVRLEDGPAIFVEGEPLALTRLFSNIVDNAVKYGSSAALRASSIGEHAVIEVRDEGPGIAPEDLEKVFHPFFRAQAARALDVPGVGLGLSVARSIAQAHGGEVTLEQALGAGLKVVVRLPLGRVAEAAAQSGVRTAAEAPRAALDLAPTGSSGAPA
jgi:signal transduction histidine kinase